jgi:hypothetical protein
MLSPCLDDDPYSFDFLADSFYFDFSDQFQTAFGFADFLPADGSLFSFGSYDHEFDDVSYTFSVESYMGVGNHRPRSVGQTTSIAKRVVSKNPVGILNF